MQSSDGQQTQCMSRIGQIPLKKGQPQQHLIKFFDVMRGTLMAAPSKLLPVI